MSWSGGKGGGGGGNELQTFLNQLKDASQAQDGKAVARLLSLKSMRKPVGEQIARWGSPDRVMKSMKFGPDIEVFLPDFLRSVELVTKGDLKEAIKCYSDLYGAFTKHVIEAEVYEWLIPILKRMSNDLRLIGVVHNRQQASTSIDTEASVTSSVETVATIFQGKFRDMTKQSLLEDMRPVVLHLVCQLLKCYFKIKKVQLCKPLIQNLMDTKFPIIDSDGSILPDLAMGDVVTYMFFRGRLYLLEGNYERANDCLSHALRFNHSEAHSHKQAILAYLIPVKLNLGQLPPPGFLVRYRLPEFGSLLRAVREGNVVLYEEELSNHMDTLIMRGTYLILEKLKFFAYRNFFKKVYLLRGSVSRLDLKVCFRLLQSLQPDTDIDLDEVECVVANLIYRDYIKGYISHKDAMLVLSKTNPFPPISDGKGFGYQ